MSQNPDLKGARPAQATKTQGWLPGLSWGVAIVMVALMVYLLLQRTGVAASAPLTQGAAPAPAAETKPTQPLASGAELPALSAAAPGGLARKVSLHTNIPQRSRVTGMTYKVEEGDSVFALAEAFKLKPETILWANYAVLNDNPDMLAIGQQLTIPPADGIYYKWKEGDTFESVAQTYKARVQDIILYPGNNLDMINPQVTPGTMVMIPGGSREFRQSWIIPSIPRGAAGVAVSIPGACTTGAGGAIGTGVFMWPGPVKKLSGNDYWSGHLAIDIAIGTGTPVVAADSGVVVFAGWSSLGYGYMVMIDHGNGFQTVYGHLSAVTVACGASVYKGNQIGLGGSTGNSTGPHLHFEMRYMGGFVNPKIYLR